MSEILRRLLPFALILIIAFSGVYVLENVIFSSEENPGYVSPPPDLLQITDDIEGEITLLTGEIRAAAGKLSEAAPDSLQGVLTDAYSDSGYAVSYAFMSPDGILKNAITGNYSGFAGIDAGTIRPENMITDSKTPVMTDAFVTPDGSTAVVISYPVYSAGGEYLGAVLCMAEPAEFLGDIIAPFEDLEGMSITVMETDGYILYDKDPAQVGKNLFTDPYFSQYTGLVNLGHMISSKETGYGTYTFYDPSSASKKPVKKQAYWDTVKNPGPEWRVILFKTAVSSV
ncbi:MAG: cache domain-containing protein [Methanomicrobiaceae archaeon]|nr:cache domain-containing protein [Methanomicrobiaceae archaeon]